MTTGGQDADQPTDYHLLPDLYTTESILKLLQRNGMEHEQSDNTDFFAACSSQFTKRQPHMSKDETTTTSIAVVKMLQKCEALLNVSTSYLQGQASLASLASLANTWVARKKVLTAAPVFLTAELSFPYNALPHKPLVSLNDSEDHSKYRLLSNARLVTSNVHGDTKPLRSKLGIDSMVFKASLQHLFEMASNSQILSVFQQQHHPLQASLLEDVQQIYDLTMTMIDASLTDAGAPSTAVHTWHNLLKSKTWILVQKKKFVRPDQLCFDTDSHCESGKHSQLQHYLMPVPATEHARLSFACSQGQTHTVNILCVCKASLDL